MLIRYVFSVLTFTALFLSTTSSAIVLPKDFFLSRCEKIASMYNGTTGSRKVPFEFKNYIGKNQNSSTEMRVVALKNCVANSRSVSVMLERVNQVNIKVRVTFTDDGSSDMAKNADTFSDCVTTFKPSIMDAMKKDGVVFSAEFEADLSKNLEVEYCPKMQEAVKNDLITVIAN